MPSVITHHLLAEQVYNDCRLNKVDKQAFLLGALGPDFFYSSANGNFAELGSLFHHSNALTTLNTLLKSAADIDSTSYAFALGFLTHYALDSVVHPYVLSLVEEMLPMYPQATEHTLHDKIETNLDVIILRSKTGKLPSEVILKELIPQDNSLLDSVCNLLSQAVATLFEREISSAEVKTIYGEYRKFLSKYQDNTGIKKPFYKRLEILKGIPPIHTSRIRSIMEDDDIDYSNSSKTEWAYKGIKSCADFFEMFENAAELSSKLIAVALNGQSIEPQVGKIGFI